MQIAGHIDHWHFECPWGPGAMPCECCLKKRKIMMIYVAFGRFCYIVSYKRFFQFAVHQLNSPHFSAVLNSLSNISMSTDELNVFPNVCW